MVSCQDNNKQEVRIETKGMVPSLPGAQAGENPDTWVAIRSPRMKRGEGLSRHTKFPFDP